MKIKNISISVLLAFSSFAGAAGTVCPVSHDYFVQNVQKRVLHPEPGHVTVFAHRACHAAAPENSVTAINECWKQGVEVVENDVRRTKDGALIVFHNADIKWITDKWGYVGDLTLEQIKAANLNERNTDDLGRYYTSEKIATLDEYFEAIKNKTMVDFELKPATPGDYQKMFDESVALARKHGVLDHLIFKIPDSIHHGVVAKTHMLDTLKIPSDVMIKTMIWQSPTPIKERLNYFEKFNPVAYEITFQDPAYVEGALSDPRFKGKTINMIAVQPEWSGGLGDAISMAHPAEGWGRLVKMGGNSIMTDRPEALLRYLESENLRQSDTDNCRRR